MGDIPSPGVQATKIKELMKDLEEVKRENESSVGRLLVYKVCLKNSEIKREEEQLKRPAVARGF